MLAQGRLKDFGPLLLIWGAAMLVLVETNDLGSALLYFGIFLAMLYVATGRALLRRDRARALRRRRGGRLHDDRARPASASTAGSHPVVDDVHGACYQTRPGPRTRSRTAASAAPGFGRGTFTTTRAGTHLIPYLNTDFIYSALAQELGLIGIAALLLVYMVFACAASASRSLAEDGFSKLLAAGLTFALRAADVHHRRRRCSAMIPLTGITLPFVSYGGSSIVANFVLLAGLLLVSNRANAAPR